MARTPEALYSEVTDAVVAETIAKINRCARLHSNWDGEDAPAISKDVSSRASDLVRIMAGQARARGLSWTSPSVAPNAEGGIDLSWEMGDRWAMLSFQPQRLNIECATQEGDAEPKYEEKPIEEAIRVVLRATTGPE
jgi:hypothetical protein